MLHLSMAYRDYTKYDKPYSFGTVSTKCHKIPWVSAHNNMKSRCNNPNQQAYKYYGGRGIKCFITLKDIKKLWFRDKAYLLKIPSIDREDNDGNYTYDNCRFIELSENVKKMNREKYIKTASDFLPNKNN